MPPWSCQNCTLVNAEANTICAACGSAKERGRSSLLPRMIIKPISDVTNAVLDLFNGPANVVPRQRFPATIISPGLFPGRSSSNPELASSSTPPRPPRPAAPPGWILNGDSTHSSNPPSLVPQGTQTWICRKCSHENSEQSTTCSQCSECNLGSKRRQRGQNRVHVPVLNGVNNASGTANSVMSVDDKMGIDSIWPIVQSATVDEDESEDVEEHVVTLGSLSILLLLDLACHHPAKGCNPFKETLSLFHNSQEVSSLTTDKTTVKLHYNALYERLCATARQEPPMLLLYLLLHRNSGFRNFVLSRIMENLLADIRKKRIMQQLEDFDSDCSSSPQRRRRSSAKEVTRLQMELLKEERAIFTKVAMAIDKLVTVLDRQLELTQVLCERIRGKETTQLEAKPSWDPLQGDPNLALSEVSKSLF